MSIILCASCGKRISSKAKVCGHCGAAQRGAADEDVERAAALVRRNRIRGLQMQSYAAMLLFLAGIILWYLGYMEGDSLRAHVSRGVLAVGVIWYLVNRVRMVMVRRR